MPISFQLPDVLEQQLRQTYGSGLDQRAKEAFLVDLYRARQVSLGQIAEILGMALYEASGWLKQRGQFITYEVRDLDDDLRALRRSPATRSPSGR